MGDFQKIVSEAEDQETSTITYKITSYPADFTLEVLNDKWGKKEITIAPFQRGFVWSISQASKLIESFLLGLPVPGIFFYRDKKTQELLVVDGQQRLRSVFSYLSNVWPDTKKHFYLKDVAEKWIGKTFADLDETDKRALKNAVLRATVIEQVNPEDRTSIFHIFERLNTGGTPLKLQEVRNCIYHGIFNDLLKELNTSEELREIIGIHRLDKRMRDIELILRFLALLHQHKNYKRPMKEFLSGFMSKYINNSSETKRFRTIFQKTISAIRKELGSNLFRVKVGLNAAVFDSVMVAFALNLDKIPADIKSRYKKLLRDEAYLDSVSNHTTDEKTVKQRISLAMQILFKS